MKIKLMCLHVHFQMVRTRRGTRTDLTPTRDESRGTEDGEDPLGDTASHVPMAPMQSQQAETSSRRTAGSRRATAPPVAASTGAPRQPTDAPEQWADAPGQATSIPGQAAAPRPTMPTSVPGVDPSFFEMMARMMAAGLASFGTPPTPAVPVSADNVVTLVRLVKSMREMGCEQYMGAEDAEVAGRWIRRVERTLVQI